MAEAWFTLVKLEGELNAELVEWKASRAKWTAEDWVEWMSVRVKNQAFQNVRDIAVLKLAESNSADLTLYSTRLM